MIKKSLIAQLTLVTLLISASTQAFGIFGLTEINKYFEENPKLKKAFTAGIVVATAVGVPALLGYIESKQDFNNRDVRYYTPIFNPVLNIISGLITAAGTGYLTHRVPALSIYSVIGIGLASLGLASTNYGASIANLK